MYVGHDFVEATQEGRGKAAELITLKLVSLGEGTFPFTVDRLPNQNAIYPINEWIKNQDVRAFRPNQVSLPPPTGVPPHPPCATVQPYVRHSRPPTLVLLSNH